MPPSELGRYGEAKQSAPLTKMPVFAALQNHPILQGLGLDKILQFLRLSSYLKNDILLCQPSHVSVDYAPEILPPSIAAFLSGATGIALGDIDSCWDVLKDDAWEYPSLQTITRDDEDAFINHGWARGLCNFLCSCSSILS